MRLIISFMLLVLLNGCTKTSSNSEKKQVVFFDLKAFFEKEAKRLDAVREPVLKTVSRNNVTEEKRLRINWKAELALFSESDINRPAWKNSYHTVTRDNTIEYAATDSNLRTKSILIKKNRKGQINHIQIHNRTANFLYNSVEKLDYYPDSVYIIEQLKSVKLIGSNHYRITASLK